MLAWSYSKLYLRKGTNTQFVQSAFLNIFTEAAALVALMEATPL